MWFTGWCLLWTAILNLATSTPGPALYVDENATECKRKEESLFCDFKNSAQDTVYMNTSTGNIKKVFVHNVKNLNMSEPVCVNVALYKVDSVIVVDGKGDCSREIEFTAKTTTLNRIPGSISSLTLEECEVDSVMTNFPLDKFNIIKSNIKLLELKDSFLNGTNAEIKESNISDFSKLVIGSGSTLSIDKSTITIAKDKALDIRGGRVTIQDSLVIASEGSVALSAGDRLTLINQQGLNIAITADPNTCEQLSIFRILLFICVVLLLLSWIFIGFLFYYCKDVLLPLLTCKRESSDSQNVRRESDPSLKDPLLTEPPEGVKNAADNIKKEYKSELKDYMQKEEKLQKQLNQLRNSSNAKQEQSNQEKYSTDINIKLDKFTNRIKFLDSLKKKEVTIASKLVCEIWNFHENDRKETEEKLKKNIESDYYVNEFKEIYNDYLSTLKVMCALLKADKEIYQNELFKPQENLIKCSRELEEKIKKDSKLKNILFEIVESFERSSLEIFLKLQKNSITEARKIIEQTSKLLQYMAGILPFKSKDKESAESQSIDVGDQDN